METPVLLLIYNRPETSRTVFEAIRHVRPRRLFVAADGPSQKRTEDQTRCAETRHLIEAVDWDCEVRTLFRDENLGCRRAISGAITWFFEHVERGIILEDDCLPSRSFFRFCQELLERYRDKEEVMVISGDNFQNGRVVTRDSYYFSRYPHCWGWATWRRAWQKYDDTLPGWPAFQDSQPFLELGADNPLFKNYWSRNFSRVVSGEVDSWAYAWTYNCWVHGGLTAIPEKNLVKNIGFGPEATHTTSSSKKINAMQAGELDFPLRHPTRVQRHKGADQFADEHHFGICATAEPSLLGRLKQVAGSLLSPRGSAR